MLLTSRAAYFNSLSLKNHQILGKAFFPNHESFDPTPTESFN